VNGHSNKNKFGLQKNNKKQKTAYMVKIKADLDEILQQWLSKRKQEFSRVISLFGKGFLLITIDNNFKTNCTGRQFLVLTDNNVKRKFR